MHQRLIACGGQLVGVMAGQSLLGEIVQIGQCPPLDLALGQCPPLEVVHPQSPLEVVPVVLLVAVAGPGQVEMNQLLLYEEQVWHGDSQQHAVDHVSGLVINLPE